MARMHTRRKGKAGSTRPYRTEPPEWSIKDPEELGKIILDLRSHEKSTSEIGMALRDAYGVPSARLVLGKRITQFLKEKEVASERPEDLENLMIKAIRLKKHLDVHRKDLHNKRALHLTEAKIRRLVKYYKREGTLPEDWRYSIDRAEMIISR
ncbi:MAG: 30S ribosomal protein S15 [Candidatus Methanolliviera sp. GoM_asphalt]|nr:MAG: 30S ribosomal protein S15 [Candidatus Methanolliviera sp. GoM_asphalt]